MKLYLSSNRINLALIGLFVLLGLGSFIYNQYLIRQILHQEKMSIELWAKGVEYTSRSRKEKISRDLLEVANYLKNSPQIPDSVIQLVEDAEGSTYGQSFITQEIVLNEERFFVPRIIVKEQGDIISSNHVDRKLNQQLISDYASMNEPIEIKIGRGEQKQTQYVYYGESPTVHYLRYFPLIQLSLLAVLLGVGFLSYQTISRSEQSNLWVGMAKEAAHQLGTPLSSLYGWVELLREQKGEDEFIQQASDELENDIDRVQEVAERFNKIGSEPELVYQRLEPIVQEVVDYMEHRLPQLGEHVDVLCQIDAEIKARVNQDIFQWALENLIKNAMDAIKASATKAQVTVRLHRRGNDVIIDITDTGVEIGRASCRERVGM